MYEFLSTYQMTFLWTMVRYDVVLDYKLGRACDMDKNVQKPPECKIYFNMFFNLYVMVLLT